MITANCSNREHRWEGKKSDWRKIDPEDTDQFAGILLEGENTGDYNNRNCSRSKFLKVFIKELTLIKHNPNLTDRGPKIPSPDVISIDL